MAAGGTVGRQELHRVNRVRQGYRSKCLILMDFEARDGFVLTEINLDLSSRIKLLQAMVSNYLGQQEIKILKTPYTCKSTV